MSLLEAASKIFPKSFGTRAQARRRDNRSPVCVRAPPSGSACGDNHREVRQFHSRQVRPPVGGPKFDAEGGRASSDVSRRLRLLGQSRGYRRVDRECGAASSRGNHRGCALAGHAASRAKRRGTAAASAASSRREDLLARSGSHVQVARTIGYGAACCACRSRHLGRLASSDVAAVSSRVAMVAPVSLLGWSGARRRASTAALHTGRLRWRRKHFPIPAVIATTSTSRRSPVSRTKTTGASA